MTLCSFCTAVLIPDNGLETDNTAATFWITNPSNTWIDNVVAGSENFGMWFELLKRGPRAGLAEYADLNPRRDSIVKVEGMEFHSVGVAALKYYLNGWEPTSLQTFKGLKFNRNKNAALLVHRTRNIRCEDCFFQVSHFLRPTISSYLHVCLFIVCLQDNSRAVVVEQASEIHVLDSTIIGHSPTYQRASELCSGNKGWLHGISFQSTNPFFDLGVYESPLDGVILENINFSGFPDGACNQVFALGLDDKDPIDYLTMEMYSTLTNVNVAPGNNKVDFCNGIALGIDDMYLTDVTGSLGQGPAPHTILRDTPQLMHFLASPSSCTTPTSCLTTCPGTCFRSIHIYTHVDSTSGYKLRICDRNDSNFPCMDVAGLEREKRDFTVRRFTVHVPSGRQYDAKFVDENGNDVYPEDVDVIFRDKMCATAPSENDFRVLGTFFDFCDRLTEDSLARDSSNWKARSFGSIASPQVGDTVKYIAGGSANLNSGPEYLPFDSDHNRECFRPGTRWEFRARLRLLQTGTNIGSDCDPTSTSPYECPVIQLTMRDGEGALRQAVVRGLSTWDKDDFNQFSGVFEVPADFGRPRKLRVTFAQIQGDDLLVENFLVVAEGFTVPVDPCTNLIEIEDTLPVNENWSSRGRGAIVPVSGFPDVVRWETNRNNGRRVGPELFTFDSQDVRDCMQLDTVWEISAMVRLNDRNGNGGACSESSQSLYVGCPAVLVSFYDSGNVLREKVVYGYDGISSWDPNDFNAFVGQFTISADVVVPQITRVRLSFARFPRRVNLDIKDLSVKKIGP